MSMPPPLPDSNPYAAPIARVEDTWSGQLELADRLMRLVAVFVDSFIFGGVVLLCMLPVIFVSIGSGADSKPSDAVMAVSFSLVGIGMLALIIVNMVMLHRSGQTIAKRLLGIRILRTDGSHCSLLRIIFARWLPVGLLGAIPFIGVIFSLIDPLLIFRSDQRCLHDLIADTIVVKV